MKYTSSPPLAILRLHQRPWLERPLGSTATIELSGAVTIPSFRGTEAARAGLALMAAVRRVARVWPDDEQVGEPQGLMRALESQADDLIAVLHVGSPNQELAIQSLH